MRELVIGDIHGGWRALIQVLVRCNYDPANDRIIFLGDYVDGWPGSAEVIQSLINLKKEATYDHIFIRGNHDKWCEDWLLMGQAPIIWTQQGGQATIDSYICTGHIASEEHKDFFRNMKNWYIDDENRGFVHGGYSSTKGLGHQSYQSDYYWMRDLLEIAMVGQAQFESDGIRPRVLRAHSEIYVGHTSTLNYKYSKRIPPPEGYELKQKIVTPMNLCNLWNLDTGGGFGGRLTVMDVNTKQYWQSDLLKELYPKQLGR